MLTSSLIRVLTHVDAEGKLALPRNLLLALDLKQGDRVELKLIGPSQAPKITISKIRHAIT